MPGRTPAEAVSVFLEPIQAAVSCLGTAKITLSPRGRGGLDIVHLLSVNSGSAMKIDKGLTFDVRLRYEIIRTSQSEIHPFRVTTRAYLHAVAAAGGNELITAHWHPTGASSITGPHYHMGVAALAPDGVFTPRAHIPSPRVSVETMVRLCIEQFGCQAVRDDWREVLDRCEDNFTKHRSWHM